MKSQSLLELIDTLVALAPGTAATEAPKLEIEGVLMGALHSGGREAGEALVESLAAQGYALERLDALPCMRRLAIPPPRVLEIWLTGGDDSVVAAVSYRVGKPWGSRAQKSAAKRQAAFYERYARLNAQGDALAAGDRLILLVGELEADVNNGGFGQYIDNKVEERAREALAALSAMGARRTGRWLATALEAGADAKADELERLDQQFNEAGEDLASLAMLYLGRKK